MTAAHAAGPEDDTSLVAAYRAGDQRAAAELVRRHGRALGGFLHAAGASASDVEDLVQEAFFRAFRRIESWRGQASFRSWLCTIGSNLLKDHFRRAARRTVIPIEGHEVVDGGDPAAHLAAHETAERIRALIAGLPRLQRDVFLLRVQQGLSYSEIAATLESSEGAARVHYHHAVRKLKEGLQ